MLKKLRALVVFAVVLMGGIAIISWWLPNMLQGPQGSQLPPAAQTAAQPQAEEEDVPVAVRTFKATRIEFTDLLPSLGTVRGKTEVELKFEANGILKVLEFREGDFIEKGQIIGRLDDREQKLRKEYAESKIATAQKQLKLAKKRMSINEELYRIGAIILPKLEESQIEVEQAQTQVTTARKEADLAANELARTVMRSPMTGVVGTKEAEPGEYVTQQSVIATLMDVDDVFVELGIIEKDIERIRLGQRVTVTVDSLPNTPFEGVIDNLAPLIEGKSRTLTAKVMVKNTQGQLLPGMFARADVAVFEKPDALVVPTSALKDIDGDGTFESVFTVGETETATLKPIELGYLTTDYAEIASGLIDGEQVVTEARGELKDGSQVTLLEVEESTFNRAEPETLE